MVEILDKNMAILEEVLCTRKYKLKGLNSRPVSRFYHAKSEDELNIQMFFGNSKISD